MSKIFAFSIRKDEEPYLKEWAAAHPAVEREGCAFWLLPAFATTPLELQQAAETLGITVSQRSCYRILNFEVSPLGEIRRLLVGDAMPQKPGQVDLLQDRRKLKISREDTEEFTSLMARDFEMLAERYYLDLAGDVKVRVAQDKVVVTFPISKQL